MFILYELSPCVSSYLSKKEVPHKIKRFLQNINLLLGVLISFISLYLFILGPIRYPPISISNLNRTFILLLLLISINLYFKYKFDFRKFYSAAWEKLSDYRRKGVVLNLLIAAFIFSALFSPILINLLSIDYGYMKDLPGVAVHPHLEDLFSCGAHGNSTVNQFLLGIKGLNIERVVAVGLVPLTLVIYSMLHIKNKKNLDFWYLTAGVFTLFALGPNLNFFGRDLLWLPYKLTQSLPLISGARSPSRYIIITMLAVGVICALSIQHILKNLQAKGVSRLMIGSLALILLPGIAVEYSVVPVRTKNLTVPEFYSKIAEEPEDYSILEVPFGIFGKGQALADGAHTTGLYQFYQSVHKKKLLSGTLSYIPPDIKPYYKKNEFIMNLTYLQYKPKINDIPKGFFHRPFGNVAEKFANLYNIRYIIIHKDHIRRPARPLRFVKRYLQIQLSNLEEIENSDSLLIYRLPEVKKSLSLNRNLLLRRNDLSLIEGFSDINLQNKKRGRFALGEKAKIAFALPIIDDVILKITASQPTSALRKEQEIKIKVNGRYLTRFILPPDPYSTYADKEITVSIDKKMLAAGTNLVVLEFDRVFDNNRSAWLTEIRFEN